MRLLMVGGAKGAWQMRGRQVGAALGARIAARPQPHDWTWAEVAILVKRAAQDRYRDAKAAAERGTVLIWDPLDFWMQPSANGRTEEDLTREVVQLARALGVRKIIGATQAMATDIGGVYIPHHSRANLVPTPPAYLPTVVAYDGSPRYLGVWQHALEQACRDRGLRFVINPEDLSKVDLLVAFRDKDWDGWACRRWKSGVKYVNAIAAGRPILTQPCAAFDEIQPIGGAIDHPDALGHAMDLLLKDRLRQDAYEVGLARAGEFSLYNISTQYQRVIREAMAA